MEDHYMLHVRHLRGFLLSAAITITVLSVGSTPVRAQTTQVFTVVDENGHGTINGFLGLQPLSFSIIPDPGPGGKPNALAYNLMNPPSLVGGDIILFEQSFLQSDLLRFDPSTGGGTLFFYSNPNAGEETGALADIGLATGLNTNAIGLEEVPLAQGLGAIYTPTAGQPGFVGGSPVPVTYTFISERISTPEPASLFLLLTGGTILLGLGVLRGRT